MHQNRLIGKMVTSEVENPMGEGKNGRLRLDFDDHLRLALFVLAYNLGNLLRRFALPGEVSNWSLRSVQLKLKKIGARIISHARRTVFQMAL
jgi:hypothetical protein